MAQLKLSGKEKALIFLSTLGDDVSAKVLNCLPEKLSTRISEELAKFDRPAPEAIALVFRELNKFALEAIQKPKLTGAIDSEASTEPLDSLSQLGRRSPQQLFTLLNNEQPQIIAFVLSYLSKNMQEKFYQLLSPGRRSEIKRLAVQKVTISDVAFEKINEKLLMREMVA